MKMMMMTMWFLSVKRYHLKSNPLIVNKTNLKFLTMSNAAKVMQSNKRCIILLRFSLRDAFLSYMVAKPIRKTVDRRDTLNS
jgi:hypothetical protein